MELKNVAIGAICALSAVLGGCVSPPEYNEETIYDPLVNYDALCREVGERYCFFAEKDIDWDKVCAEKRKKLKRNSGDGELFSVMSELLDELKDGHVNLVTPFATSYYKKWWSDYPQDFNWRTLQEYYLKFGGLQTGGIQYCIFMPENVGYIYYPSFSSTVSELSLDYVLTMLAETDGLIIDVRDNGGGNLTNVPILVGRFINEKIIGGYIRHKTGPGHNDFSEPYAIYYEPSADRVHYDKEICVLTNRSTYSAANDFVSVMSGLPQVRIVGAVTGGGGGMPATTELPNGWAVRYSASPITDAKGRNTENGIAPHEGCEVHCTAAELAAGKDAILDFALKLF